MMQNNLDTRPLLVGMFKDKERAEAAYAELRRRNYPTEEINVVMSSTTREKYFTGKNADHKDGLGNKALEGTGVGSAVGGVVGAIAGALAAIGTSIAIPGLGLVIAGPIAAALAGAGAGGLAGGLIGALVGLGIPEERAKIYREGIQNGEIVVSVRPHNETDVRELSDKWHEFHPEAVRV
ncbi:MAG TPA: hypothetical protein VEY71_12675 [Chitinophagales bacterium]|nr:hypothetical protein [Chitinophagales bacterium]